jgi:hypothetical protein
MKPWISLFIPFWGCCLIKLNFFHFSQSSPRFKLSQFGGKKVLLETNAVVQPTPSFVQEIPNLQFGIKFQNKYGSATPTKREREREKEKEEEKVGH